MHNGFQSGSFLWRMLANDADCYTWKISEIHKEGKKKKKIQVLLFTQNGSTTSFISFQSQKPFKMRIKS